MFKVNIKNNRTTSVIKSLIDFEQLNVIWEGRIIWDIKLTSQKMNNRIILKMFFWPEIQVNVTFTHLKMTFFIVKLFIIFFLL